MVVASIYTFRSDPSVFYEWMRPLAGLLEKAKPNAAHLALAELEELGLLKAVITQNIDGLHQMAGSTRVLELHGHLREAVCLRCGLVTPTEGLIQQYVLEGKVPHCRDCGGTLKPVAVLMGEPLPTEVFREAERESQTCDLMLVAGSSLTVVPAASLPLAAHQQGAELIIVNVQETPADALAEVVMHEDLAEVLPQIVTACRTSLGRQA
jgi:NAD-dependent deacetylase